MLNFVPNIMIDLKLPQSKYIHNTRDRGNEVYIQQLIRRIQIS